MTLRLCSLSCSVLAEPGFADFDTALQRLARCEVAGNRVSGFINLLEFRREAAALFARERASGMETAALWDIGGIGRITREYDSLPISALACGKRWCCG